MTYLTRIKVEQTAAEKRYCIIGAGACGLPVAKSFVERGIAFDCFEALSDVGGIWNPQSPHRVYGSTYLNSSQKLSRYMDFKFAEGLPHYLSATQAEDYLRAYASHFGVYDKISFNSEVVRAERTDGRWQVRIKGEEGVRDYDGLVVANGHHWSPKMPELPGHFDGEILHSHDVKSKDQLAGKRVLVVGAGNSAVDILSDAAQVGKAAVHSMRRSYYFFPKMVFGRPTDRFIDLTSRWPVPRSVMRLLYKAGVTALVGSHQSFGLPAPDHNLFEAHPTACTTYLDHIVHGRVTVHPGIERVEGDRVHFVDGSSAAVDLIVFATGYELSFPFLDSSYVLDENGRSRLFIHSFHRELDDFFVAGLFEPAEGGVWQLADYQGKLIGSFIVAMARDSERAAWFHRLKEQSHPDIGHGIPDRGTAWHKFEIQHYRFRKYMKRLLKQFGAVAEQRMDGAPIATQPAQAPSEAA